MRLARADILPLLAIMGGGAVGLVTSAALVFSARTDYASAPVRHLAAPEPAPVRPVWSADGTSVVWSPDGTPLVWSPDGTWLSFECGRGDASAVSLPKEVNQPREQFCLGPDGSAWIVRRTVPEVRDRPSGGVIRIRFERTRQRR